MQFYGTAGGGVYRETLTRRLRRRNVGINVGGGVKISLVGPLRLRLDYRVFTLQGDAAALEAAAVLRGDQPEVLRSERACKARQADKRASERTGLLQPVDCAPIRRSTAATAGSLARRSASGSAG